MAQPPDPSAQTDPKAPMSALPGAGLTLGILLGINLLNYADRYLLAAVEPKVRAEFFPPGSPGEEHAATYMGMLSTAFLVAYMVASPIFGWLADRLSRLVIISVGVALFSLASGASGLAGVFGVLVLSRILVGIGEAAYGPTAPTVISDLFPVRKRGAVLAWFYMAIPVGTAAGYMFGGQLATMSGSWRLPFYAVVLPGLVLAAVCLALRDPPRGGSDGVSGHRKMHWRDYKTLLQTPSYILATAGMTAMTFAVGGVSFWMPTYIHEFRNGLPANDPALGTTNLIFGGITVVAGILGTLIGGYLADRWHRRNSGAYFLLAGLGMLFGFPMFIAVLYTPFPYAWALMFGSIFCFMLGTGPANAVLANVTHPSVRASAFAINIFIIHALGDAISPMLMGTIMDATRELGPASLAPAGMALTSIISAPGATPIGGAIQGVWMASVHFRGARLGDMNLAFLTVGLAVIISGLLWAYGARFLERDTRLAPSRIS